MEHSPHVKILNFEIHSNTTAQQLKKVVRETLEKEWARGNSSLFDENGLIDAVIILYWSGNERDI